jgi:BirA family transcriptional regulator, biotin operon repressor / biotin---[acetyl-CoA-carboxylase] ligase
MSPDPPGQEARFPALNVRRVARTTSTQDVVLRAARAGAAEGFCCLANEQTAGRGRQGREWIAPAGSALLASVLLRRSLAVAPGIPFAAGLAVIDALLETCGLAARLKWPNDVLAGGHKLAGILSEVAPGSTEGGRVAVALGLGLNLRVEGFPAGVDAVSLHTLVEHPPGAEVLLLAWGNALRARVAELEVGGVPAVVAGWRQHSIGLGSPVIVESASGTLEGVAVDVAADGALLVASAGGQVHRVVAGEVHLGSCAATSAPAPAEAD